MNLPIINSEELPLNWRVEPWLCAYFVEELVGDAWCHRGMSAYRDVAFAKAFKLSKGDASA